MFCEKCGTKNDNGSKFCEKCGNPMSDNPPKKTKTKSKENKKPSKFKALPKKTKIIMGIVLVIVVAALIALFILLNNPIKKVEDYLESYYANYTEKNKEELVEINKIIKSHKNDKKVLNNIKDTTSKAMEKWVTNFNTEYKDVKDLEKAYEKVTGALGKIYKYYKGSKYMLEEDKYNEYMDGLNDLYQSKKYYLSGKSYEDKNEGYSAYYNYQKVIEKDSYYRAAQNFIESYIADELNNLKSAVEALVKDVDDVEEQLESYIEQVDYLEDHKYANNVDLSTTDTYKNLYNSAVSNVLEKTKAAITELEKDLDYGKIIKLIDEAIEGLYNASDSAEYKELVELKENYKDKMPDELVDKYVVDYDYGAYSTSYNKTINGKVYSSNISFNFSGKTLSRIFRINGDYKRLKTTIVRGENWDKSFKGTIVIYGDDKELYRSAEITKSSELKPNIDIDITGVDDLKVQFITTSKSSGWTDFNIYLVEPYLYK